MVGCIQGKKEQQKPKSRISLRYAGLVAIVIKSRRQQQQQQQQ